MSKKYIHQIGKRLKCSSKRRKEIEKELSSDFMSELENGVKEQEIIQRMGTPAELAEEFNNTFSKEEQKKYKKEKWIKRISAIVVGLVFFAGILYWFLPKSKPIEESKLFQKEEAKKQAERVIELLNEEDYKTLRECSIKKMKQYFDKETMDELKALISEEWGEFQDFGSVYVAETKQMGKTFASVQINASYENVTVTYVLAFDEEMKIAGFWMR
ncbi:MAG: DUF3887 domain-containing protein [Lachnospiraceae bacterium]|nr:DUF3887 domain-containing protein [Lachnospiraceae bacterium]